jgi:hypothetical protein
VDGAGRPSLSWRTDGANPVKLRSVKPHTSITSFACFMRLWRIRRETKVSRLNKNFAVTYVFLVVLPIFGLVGILRSGQNLEAPTSVDGLWTIQAAAIKGAMPSCMSALGLDLDTPITISQSGKKFAINTGKTGGSGLIEGTTLQASLMPAGTLLPAPNCGGDGSVLFTATVEARASPRVLSGMMSLAGCPSCESVKFHAIKQASMREKGAQ